MDELCSAEKREPRRSGGPSLRELLAAQDLQPRGRPSEPDLRDEKQEPQQEANLAS